MQYCFIKERNCTDNFTVAIENKLLLIKIYERILINIEVAIVIENEKEKNIILLINVVYILNFMINIVFENILKEKELHFNTKYRHLHRKKKAIFFALKVKNHYVLKNNIKSTVNVFITKVISAIKFEISYK